jgi:putative AlgH/UPF0301 family transcriptional regulator
VESYYIFMYYCTDKIIVNRHLAGCFAGSYSNHIIYIFQHNSKGAIGLLLNGGKIGNITSNQLKDIFNTKEGKYEKFKDMLINGNLSDIPLFLGGNETTKGIYFIHSYPEYSQIIDSHENKEKITLNSVIGEEKNKNKLREGVYFGTPFTFAEIVESEKIDVNRFRFYFGQQSWVSGQLESEIQAGYWSVIDADEEYFFSESKCENLASLNQKRPDFFSMIAPSLN